MSEPEEWGCADEAIRKANELNGWIAANRVNEPWAWVIPQPRKGALGMP